jgi:hypothetical protein
MKVFILTSMGFALLLFQPSCSTQRAISNYSGDGEIKAMPYYGFWQRGGGYTVRFKPIKLDRPNHLVYHFAGIPKMAWHVDVFFAIKDLREWTDKSLYKFYQEPSQVEWAKTNQLKFANYDDLNGTLAMSLKDKNGKVIFEFQHKLSELIWSRAGLGPWELYDRDFKSSFAANSNVEYTLEINIEPDPALKDDEGYVLFRSGGKEATP